MVSLTLELEDYANQFLFSPLSVQSSSAASGGAYISWPNNGGNQINTTTSTSTNGQVAIDFATSDATSVSISVRASFATGDDDSFFYKLDSGAWQTQNNTQTSSWETINLGNFSVSAGNHTLLILRREDGSLLDSLALTVAAGTISAGGSSSSTSSSSSSSSSSSGTLPVDIQVNRQTEYQTIDGFGAALPMWTANMLTASEVRTLVGMGDNELGLSILRTIVEPDSSIWSRAVDNLTEAKSYGSNLQILASPWSPPANMKSNNSTTDGGKLLTSRYYDYAVHLNNYVEFMAGEGVDIDVVSIQNEPDWHPSYDSCDWTGTELRNFVRDYGDVIQTKVLVGESLRFNRAYTDPSLNDSGALQNFEYVGGHLYSAQSSGTFTRYPLAESRNKHRWMTEWLIHDADGSGAAIWGGNDINVWNETLDSVLASVHQSMDIHWNAYIWWWARRFYSLIGDGESQYGTTKGAILKRGWAFSQYAKFVRPGAVRVASSNNTSLSSVYITAYKQGNETVVVLLNRSNSNHNDLVIDSGLQVTNAQAYTTSRTQNRSASSATVSGSSAVVSVPARSIVTLVMNHN